MQGSAITWQHAADDIGCRCAALSQISQEAIDRFEQILAGLRE